MKILLLILILSFSIIGIIVPAGLGWDFANFYDSGRRAAAGSIADLYHPERTILGEEPQGKLLFVGTPISAFFYAPLSYFSPEKALLIFKIQNVLAYATGLWIVYLFNRRLAAERFAVLFCFLILIFQPFWAIFRIGGQTTPTVFLLLSLIMCAHVKFQYFLSAFCFVLAVLIKPVFLVALFLLVLLSPFRFAAFTAMWITFWFTGSILLLGWDIHQQFVSTLFKVSTGPYPWLYNTSLYVALDNLRQAVSMPAAWFRGGVILLKIFIVSSLGYLVIRSRVWKIDRHQRNYLYFLFSITFCLFLADTVWEHYLAILFFLLIYLVALRRQFPSHATRLLQTIFALSIGQNLILILFLNDHLSWNGVALFLAGLFRSAPLLLTLVFLLIYREHFFRSFQQIESLQGQLTVNKEN